MFYVLLASTDDVFLQPYGVHATEREIGRYPCPLDPHEIAVRLTVLNQASLSLKILLRNRHIAI